MMRAATSTRSRRRSVLLGFGPRLAMAISALILVTCSILSVVVVRENIAQVRQGMWDRLRALSEQLARDSELGLLSGDALRLDELARWARAQRDVAYCSFVDTNGRVWAAQGARVRTQAINQPPPAAVEGPIEVAADLWEFRAPVLTASAPPQREELGFDAPVARAEPNEAIGFVLIGASGVNLSLLQSRILFAAGTVTLLVVIFSMIVAMALAQRMTRPLRQLATAADAVAQANLEARVDVGGSTEIGVLADSFNTMVSSLRRSQREVDESRANLEQAVRSRTERLELLNSDLEEANRLKSEFLATVSHELRTPLHVILGYTSMLEDEVTGPVNDEQKDLLSAIKRYSTLQLDLLTDVLDLSRLQSGKISFHVTEFEVAPLLREVESLFQSRIAGSGIRIAVRVATAMPKLQTDRIKLQEIVRNIVDNAVKFTKEGTIAIEAYPRDGGASVVIRVTDTGTGIDPNELPHIFEPFRQAGQSATRQTGGVGLGLSIVKQLCEALRGTCVAASEYGVGSTFQVTIPCHFPAASDGDGADFQPPPMLL